MEWLTQNWIWVLFFGGMIAMHLFGHGRHGGHGAHGGHGGGSDGGDNAPKPAGKDSAQRASKQRSGGCH